MGLAAAAAVLFAAQLKQQQDGLREEAAQLARARGDADDVIAHARMLTTAQSSASDARVQALRNELEIARQQLRAAQAELSEKEEKAKMYVCAYMHACMHARALLLLLVVVVLVLLFLLLLWLMSSSLLLQCAACVIIIAVKNLSGVVASCKPRLCRCTRAKTPPTQKQTPRVMQSH